MKNPLAQFPYEETRWLGDSDWRVAMRVTCECVPPMTVFGYPDVCQVCYRKIARDVPMHVTLSCGRGYR